jgi:hypothetical protein
VIAILATAFSPDSRSERQDRAAQGFLTETPPTAGRDQRTKAEPQRRVDAVAVRIGQMNAHIIRLDALGNLRR